MKRQTFDKKLMLAFFLMGSLAVMVGLAAVGVNRYLIGASERLVAQVFPAMDLSGRIAAEAELVRSLAASFTEADTLPAQEELSAALTRSITRIEAGIDALGMLGDEPGAIPPRDSVGIVTEMAQNAARLRGLRAQVAEAARALEASSAELSALLESELDLARLRITAGIADLSSGAPSDPRPQLDQLADRDFFAFNRLTELLHAADTLRRALAGVPARDSAEAIGMARDRIEAQRALISRRALYLPTRSGEAEAHRLLEALEPGALLETQGAALAAEAEVAALSSRLIARVEALSAQATALRENVQTQSTQSIRRSGARAKWLAGGLLALVVVSTLCGLLVWRYARRGIVTRLRGVADRIVAVARGDFGTPVTISGNDEIARMEKAVNVLRRRAIQAADLQASLQDAVAARTGDVVREMRAATEAQAEAEAANRGKSEFLARMSHEIRTPLNGVVGMLDLLRGDLSDPADRARAETALASARELVELTGDILTYSESDPLTARDRPAHFRIRDLTGQLGQYLTALAGAKGLAAEVDLNPQVPQVLFADVIKIRQIVTNLISNAVKYTETGSVSLKVHSGDDPTGQIALTFVVEDTGAGMSQAFLSQAFEPRTRTDAAARAGIEGAGLGLPISRNLTEALRGALTAQSAPGAGSRFILTVPVTPGDPDQIAGEEPTPMAALDRAVLVIEDDAVNRMVARGYFARLGCTVAEAETGTAGLAQAAQTPFDLILVDLGLPDMPGTEVITRLTAQGQGTRVAAFTADPVPDTSANRARLGVSRILTKPLSPAALLKILEETPIAPRPNAGAPPDDDAQSAVIAAVEADVADLGAEVTAQIIAELRADIPATLCQIAGAPPDQRARLAHRLKGAVATYRLDRLAALLKRVEAAPDGLPDTLQAAADEAAALLDNATHAAGLYPNSGGTKR